MVDFDLSAVAGRLFGLFWQPVSDNVVLAAVGEDLSRNTLEHNRQASMFERHSRGARSLLSLFAHHALHDSAVSVQRWWGRSRLGNPSCFFGWMRCARASLQPFPSGIAFK